MPDSQDRTALSHNLPVPLTSFIGRKRELEASGHYLARRRCLTLTGPGGCGKTRLAVEVAARQLAEYPDGIRFVELAAVSDPTMLPRALGGALDIPDDPQRPALSVVIDYLREKRLLLVLDNCEHLLDSCRAVADALIGSCQGVRLLTTSREPLGAAGETTLPVPPLTIPPAGLLASMTSLAEYEAVQLFAERATAASPRFALNVSNAAAVAELCRRLDGIPLALELAACRVNLLSPEQIVTRLTDRFRLLAAPGEAHSRHRTLRAAVDWSYEGLTAAQQRLWQRLSVFPDSFSLLAAEAVCAGDGINPEEICDLVASLVARSIVTVEERGAEPRLNLLETLREYGVEKLETSGEGDRVKDRYTQYYVALAEEADSQIYGPEQSLWVGRLEQEHVNLRVALRHVVGQADQPLALRLVCALSRFWYLHGHCREARRWLEKAVEHAVGCDPSRARALNALAAMAEMQGDIEAAGRRFAEAQSIYLELKDQVGLAGVYANLGRLAQYREDYDQAASLYEQGLQSARLVCDPYRIGRLLEHLGGLAQHRGDHRRALYYFAEALPSIRAVGDQQALAMLLNNLGSIELTVGDLQRANSSLTEALSLCRKLRDGRGLALALTNLGDVARELGDLERACACYRESLELMRDGEHRDFYLVVESMAGAEAARGNDARATRLFGAAAAVKQDLRTTTTIHDRAHAETYLDLLRSRLPEYDLQRWWDEGQAMSHAEVVAYALKEESAPGPSGARPALATNPRPAGLTKRELEVVRLVALGLATRDIGERLHISPRTVAKHEENVRSKLNIPSRVGLAAWAARSRLIQEGRV